MKLDRTVSAALALLAVACPSSVRAQQPSVSPPPTTSATAPPDDGAGRALEVVVRGNRVRPRVPPKDRGVAGSMVQGDRLKAPGKQAADVLRGEPGVAVAETGGQGALATASIRGATSAQTPVYLAGVRINDDVAGSADLSLIPLWLIQRVEVYRGNAPIEADDLGIGGAVFFEPVRPHKAAMGVGGVLGSFGTRGLWAWGADGDEHRAALVGVRIDRTKNDYPYVDDRGTRFDRSDDVERVRTNADVQTLDAWAVGTASLGMDGRVDVLVNGVTRDQGVPGLALIPTQAARFTSRRLLAAVSAASPCGADGTCLLRMSSSALVAGSTLDDPLQELELSASRVQLTGRRVDQSASVRLDVTDRVTLVPALRASVERLLVDADGAAARRASRASSRAAIGAEWRASDAWVLRALGSGECDGTSLSGMSWCSKAIPAGRVGAQLSVGALTLIGNVGHYERVPLLGELYGLAGAVRGNAALLPEKGTTAELGARSTWKGRGVVQGAHADVFAYARLASDLIAWRRATVGYVRPYNVASARLAGLEFLAGAGLGGFLDLELAATLLDPRDTSDSRTMSNDILPFRSRLVLSPSARWHTSAWSGAGIDRVALEVRYTHQSSRYADSAGLVVIPAQGALDVEASLSTLRDHLSLRLRAADALDQGRFDIIGYPLPRRAFYAATELRW